MNMIERVARAICKSDDPDNDWDSKDMSDYTRNAWSVYAKAAIEAMHEPTQVMIDEGAMIMPDYDPGNDDFLQCYQAAIDAALNEE